MSGGDAVATHGMSKRYGRETALDGVNLRVPEGAVYVLVGANGAGKSTTLKVLMNLERADAGTAEIHGLDTVRRGPEARAQVGYVPGAPRPRLPLDDVRSPAQARRRLLPDMGSPLCRPPEPRLRPAAATARSARYRKARADGCSSCWRWPIARPFSFWTSRPTASTRWCAAARCRCWPSTSPIRRRPS